MNYRYLEPGDIVQIGDEWWNQGWEVGGPWYTVKEGDAHIGKEYSEEWRKMRRPLNDGEKAAKELMESYEKMMEALKWTLAPLNLNTNQINSITSRWSSDECPHGPWTLIRHSDLNSSDE